MSVEGRLKEVGREDISVGDQGKGIFRVSLGRQGPLAVSTKSAEELASLLSEKILHSQPKRIILDLSRVRYINSRALGVIAGKINRLVGRCGAELVLESPSPELLEVLRATKVDRILEVTGKAAD